MRRRTVAGWALTGSVLTGTAMPAQEVVEPIAVELMVADEETTASAMALMRAAVTVQLDGRHHLLLRALRHRADPSLRPLFERLAEADAHPALQVHALLALAELDPSDKLKASRIAAVQSAEVRAEIIEAGLAAGLIDRQTKLELLGWHDLGDMIRLGLATPLVAEGGFDPTTPGYQALVQAESDPMAPGHGLAALLLNQMDDPRGSEALRAMLDEPRPLTEEGWASLLEVAWAHGLERSADWALELAKRPAIAGRAEGLALKVAIRFGDQRADRFWGQQWQQSEGERRMELAWIGLEVAPWLEPNDFASMREDDDPVISAIGRVAESVARSRLESSERMALVPRAGVLLATQHPRAWRWAADYAQQTGSAALAAEVLGRYEAGELRSRSRRLEAVAAAADTLIEVDSPTAVRLLRATLLAGDTDGGWRKAALLGLIRSRAESATELAQQLPTLDDDATAALALLLKLSRNSPLGEDDQALWAWIIKDGDSIDDSLRVQAAWAYLKATNPAEDIVAEVFALNASERGGSQAGVESTP